MADPRDLAEAQEQARKPYDIDVEQALLGSLLRDNSLIDVAAAEMDPEHFYDPLHARVFETIVQLRAEGKVNAATLASVMRQDPGVIETGGFAYFEALRGAAPAIPAIVEYAGILKELALRREIITIGQDMVDQARLPPAEILAKQVSADATDRLLEIGTMGKKPILAASDIAMESVREIEDAKHGKPIPVVKTGLRKLDREIGGLRGGDLVLIGGKSGMGKSALMGTVSRNTSAGHRNHDPVTDMDVDVPPVPTIVFSKEMVRRQWVERMVCDADYDEAIAGGLQSLWYSKVRNHQLTDDEFARFILASQGLPPREFLEIHDDDDLTVAQIAARVRAFAAKFARNPDGTTRLGIVIVDYLQIIQPPDWREANRERQVAAIARGLKSLAKRIGWPVLVGSQMNENDAARSKEEKRPQLSDARESKAIGQEADLFFAPFRPAYFVENRKPTEAAAGSPEWVAWKADLKAVANRMDLLTLKNRHGRRFDLELFCDMGASAIRDSKPPRLREPHEQAQADMIAGLGSDGMAELARRTGP